MANAKQIPGLGPDLCLFSSLCHHIASSQKLILRHVEPDVRYVIDDGDYILQDFGEDGVSYLSKENFDALATGEEEANFGVNLRAWSVVKLE